MILTMISTKGGVCKTTLTANLGGFLADKGNKVLMVDADIQPALSSWYPLKHQAKHGLTHLITKANTDEVISKTERDNLDLIYSDDPEGSLHIFIQGCADGRLRLRYTLNQLREKYDYILIDTQGASGPLLDAGIFAADLQLTPVSPDTATVRELSRGTIRAIAAARDSASRMGMTVAPLYAVMAKYTNTNDAKTVAIGLKKLVGRGITRFLNTVIPSKTAYTTSATLQVPVHIHDPRRKSSKVLTGEDIMVSLAAELISLRDKEV